MIIKRVDRCFLLGRNFDTTSIGMSTTCDLTNSHHVAFFLGTCHHGDKSILYKTVLTSCSLGFESQASKNLRFFDLHCSNCLKQIDHLLLNTSKN